jgi:hypothetical protein
MMRFFTSASIKKGTSSHMHECVSTIPEKINHLDTVVQNGNISTGNSYL